MPLRWSIFDLYANTVTQFASNLRLKEQKCSMRNEAFWPGDFGLAAEEEYQTTDEALSNLSFVLRQ